MGKIDAELVQLFREIGTVVQDLPDAVQPLAFQALLERCLHATPAPSPSPPQDLAPAPSRSAAGSNWAAVLAQEAGVTEERVQSVLQRDEEGFYPVHAALGDREADRTRNIAVLVLWATRVTTRDIYAPQRLVYRAHRLHKLGIRNVTNSLKTEKTIKAVTVSGEKMFQLVGEWRSRAVAIIQEHAE